MNDTRKYKGKRFINIRSDAYGVETVDECDTSLEAYGLLREYRLVYWGTGIPVWISQRPDNTWYGENDDTE